MWRRAERAATTTHSPRRNDAVFIADGKLKEHSYNILLFREPPGGGREAEGFANGVT